MLDIPAAVAARLNVGVAVCDLNARLSSANAAFVHMLRDDAWAGKTLFDYCFGDDALALAARLAELRAGAAESAPLALRLDGAADAEPVFIDARLIAWPDDPGLVAISAENVTAHRRREEALRRSEARLRAIVDDAVDAIVTCDVRGAILSANPATRRLFGYDRDLAGERVNILMPSGDAGRHDGYIDHYLVTGERRKLGIGRELTGRKSDGTLFPVWISLSEIRLPGFHVFVAMLHDLTAMKAAEKALIEARDAALLANRAKNALLANVSHELRTPLNGIIGFADILVGQLGDADSGLASFAVEIKRAGELLLANVSEILEIASIEASAAPLEETLVDFRDVAVSAVRLVAKRAQEGKLNIDVDLSGDLPLLRADPLAIKQALLHLLSNAVKFTAEGGTIGLSACIDPQDGDMAVEVWDEGCGIPADRMEAVFSPFVQEDDTLSRPHEGVGLGLTLARALTERHGGRIAMQSQENVGTTVTLRLPKSRFFKA